jgi:hypothetical protein
VRFYRRRLFRAGGAAAFPVGGHATTAGSLSTPVALIAVTAISFGFELDIESTAIWVAAPGWSFVVQTPPAPRT